MLHSDDLPAECIVAVAVLGPNGASRREPGQTPAPRAAARTVTHVASAGALRNDIDVCCIGSRNDG